MVEQPLLHTVIQGHRCLPSSGSARDSQSSTDSCIQTAGEGRESTGEGRWKEVQGVKHGVLYNTPIHIPLARIQLYHPPNCRAAQKCGLALCLGGKEHRKVCHGRICNDMLVSSAFTLTIPQFRESLRSYAATPWPLEPQHYLSFMEFEITFRPDSGDGTLLYSYDTNSKDFLSINMAGGHVEFRFDCGSGTGVLR